MKEVQLTSPHFGKGTQFCFHFYYFSTVAGEDEGFLDLDSWMTYSNKQVKVTLWSLKLGTTGQWVSASVPVNRAEVPLFLQFNMRWGTRQEGTVAIDDVRIEYLDSDHCASK